MTERDPGTTRLRLDLAYAGDDFHGWAAQPGLRTVQGVLEAALARVTRISVPITVAGRTDTGVHAHNQVVHLDLPESVLAALPGRSDRSPAQSLVTRLNGVLPEDLVIRHAQLVPSAFDARFSALWRLYRYRISDSPLLHDPGRSDVLRYPRPLDVHAMATASAQLLGEHDFLSFCRPREGATTVRTLHEFTWIRPGAGRRDEGLVVATVKADAFCHHMVRALVGALIDVGQGRRDRDWPWQVLQARTRQAATKGGVGAAPLVPAHGLTLEHVQYPLEHLLGEQAQRARTLRSSAERR